MSETGVRNGWGAVAPVSVGLSPRSAPIAPAPEAEVDEVEPQRGWREAFIALDYPDQVAIGALAVFVAAATTGGAFISAAAAFFALAVSSLIVAVLMTRGS